MKLQSILLAGALCGMVGTSHAVVINDSIVRTGGADLGTPAAWFNSGDDAVETTVNRHYFRVNTNAEVSFDILSWEAGFAPNDVFPSLGSSPQDVNGDGEISFFDAMIRLYDASTSALLAANDDSGDTLDDGSIFDRDSFIKISLAPGVYFLAVASYDFSDAEGLGTTAMGTGPMTWKGTQYVVSDHGDYRLTIVGDISSIPEPATFALSGLGLALIGTTRRKKIAARDSR